MSEFASQKSLLLKSLLFTMRAPFNGRAKGAGGGRRITLKS